MKPEDRSQKLSHYHQYLKLSIKKLQVLLEEHHISLASLQTIYLGGGTPSLWGTEGASFFSDFISFLSPKADVKEFCLEIDPGAWNEESFRAWKQIGANRFSVGMQTLDRNLFSLMDRSHSLDDSYHLLDFLNQQKVNFSIDFMLGIPRHKNYVRNILSELNELQNFAPRHISLYLLSVPKSYQHFAALPHDDATALEYLKVDSYLTSQGFNHYEVSSYSVPGFESHHNLRYWNRGNIVAFGPSASGVFYQGESVLRYKWKNSLLAEPELEVEILSLEQQQIELLYLTLRQNKWFLASEIFTELDQIKIFNDLLMDWFHQGNVNKSHDFYQLNARGWLILDTLVGQVFSKVKF